MAGGDARRGTLVVHYVADHQRPPLDRGSPETLDSNAVEGPAVANPRIRDAMGQAARTRHDRRYRTDGVLHVAGE
jgi:hypothetical protein